jgi:uncharacterized protein (DUF983 family)
MKCPNCGSEVTLFDKHTRKRIERCGNCDAKFVQNHKKKIAVSVVGLLVLTFALGFFDLGLITTSIILVPYIWLTFLYVKRIETERA